MEEGTENQYTWKEPVEPKYRERPFNAWRVPRSEAAQEVIDDVVSQLLNYEKHFDPRQRKRRKVDQESFERMVSAVICDMIYHHLTHGSEQKVYISRSNSVLRMRSRYRPQALGKKLPTILDWMSSPELGFIKMVLGAVAPFGKAKRTTIKAGPRLVTLIHEKSLSPHDLGKEPGAEVIHLKREKDDFWDDGGLIEYRDTPTTEAYRQQILKINTWLDSFNIIFDEMVLGDDKAVDTFNRSLRRIFSKGRFDHGGRLFGGFWQELAKTVRFDGLYLNDERIVELDYGQMAPRILYGMYNATPPDHDAYILPNYKFPRKGVKKVFNSLIFDETSRNRMPRGVRQYIPKRYSIYDVVHAIKVTHSGIADAFCSGIGHQVQFRESQILVSLLLQLKDQNIPALPIHDAVLVPHSLKDGAKKVMLEVFKDHTGIDALITVESGK